MEEEAGPGLALKILFPMHTHWCPWASAHAHTPNLQKAAQRLKRTGSCLF